MPEPAYASYQGPPFPTPAPSPWAAFAPAAAAIGRLFNPQAVLLLALFGGYVGYEKYHASPAPAPAPVSPAAPTLRSIVRDYLRDYPKALRLVAADRKAGKVDAGKEGDALEAARQATVDALADAMKAEPDWSKVADEFERAIKP